MLGSRVLGLSAQDVASVLPSQVPPSPPPPPPPPCRAPESRHARVALEVASLARAAESCVLRWLWWPPGGAVVLDHYGPGTHHGGCDTPRTLGVGERAVSIWELVHIY
jgi:hypothetical protein